jgi:hypothetical protein
MGLVNGVVRYFGCFLGGEVERELAKGVFGRVNHIYPSGVTKNDLPVTYTRR